MKRVIIESPLNAETRVGIEENKIYARKCVVDSLRRGEAPFASHLFYDQPGILDDLMPEERERGILAGFAWGEAAIVVAFYIDRGISRGMLRGFERAMQTDADIVVRSLETREELFIPIETDLMGTVAEEMTRMRNLNYFLQAATAVSVDGVAVGHPDQLRTQQGSQEASSKDPHQQSHRDPESTSE